MQIFNKTFIHNIVSIHSLMYVHTVESERPVCDKPYHMNNGFQQMWAEIGEKLWNYAWMLLSDALMKMSGGKVIIQELCRYVAVKG